MFWLPATYAPPGFTDLLFDRAVQQGAIISRSPALLLSTAPTLLDSKGAEFFVDGSEGSTSAKG